MYIGIFIVIILIGIGVGLFFVFKKKGGNTPAPSSDLPVLPNATRNFPSIFYAWNPTDDPASLLLTLDQRVAKHQLAWFEIGECGYYWGNGGDFWSQDWRSETLTKVPNSTYHIDVIRALNPNIKILGAIYHFDVYGSWLPVNDPWWLMKNGQRVPGWLPPPNATFCLNEDDPTLREHAARQAKAMCDAGFDGVFLDVMNETPARIDLVNKVRAAIGPNKLLICNANLNQVSYINKVNGIMMEVGMHVPDWKQCMASLDYNEKNCLSPKSNCFETRGADTDLKSMRATTALSLTHSNGYSLYTQTSVGGNSHSHIWFPFYDKNLGKPIKSTYLVDGAHVRDFENGKAVWNPPWNAKVVTVNGTQIPIGDGAIV